MTGDYWHISEAALFEEVIELIGDEAAVNDREPVEKWIWVCGLRSRKRGSVALCLESGSGQVSETA
jgi:hypothetical protein